ncbi:hypothetical protein [Paraburkholderia sp. DHOC27]|uniref:hypothetical protein n=1 Tax=Paraburkholderia sp. DHOC27 TaxID=2303330 RepID=UPI000E3CA557|nr:hypothetical protein [Paraburkholderia sp. DHOC27]RFU44861.1 hypothetical protein D0B32_24170 [Paraburkholderia sp. DHOC27]
MGRISVAVLFGLFAALRAEQAAAHDATLFDGRVTQQSIGSTICRPDYVDAVSPSISVMMERKARLLADLGISTDAGVAYALDRHVPVLLGGAPDSPANFDLLPWAGNQGERRKSRLVVRLKHCVCEGKMTLSDAQATILGNWSAAYPGFGQNSCNLNGVDVATGSRDSEP